VEQRHPPQPTRSVYEVNSTGTQAVDRAAALVSLVVSAGKPVTFAELAEVSGLARSTTSRLLAALERNRLVERDGGGSFRSGPLFALYAARHDPWGDVVRLVQPVLRQLGEQVRESVFLTVPRGRDSTATIAQVDSSYVLGARDWVGVNVPPHCSAAGKVLYAYGCLDLPSGNGQEGALSRPTPRSIASREALEQELLGVRRRGYAVTDEELEVGLCAVAAPVRGRDGEVVAAVGAHGPSARMHSQLEPVGHLLIEQAEAISGLLAHPSRKESAA
jgi:IclR family transcriptional regulator, acetate operon repressor